MDTRATNYPVPANVPARIVERLIARLVVLAQRLDDSPCYTRLDDNFGSLMLEYTLHDLKERPYPFRSESDYWHETQRRFRFIVRRNARWKSCDRARSREQLLDEERWEIEMNRRHRCGSAAERKQREDEPTRRLLEEDLPTQAQLMAALSAVGITGKRAIAWLLFRWEEAENYRELSGALLDLTGEQIPEGTLRKWEQRIFRDPQKMISLYARITGEPPTENMISRLLGQKRYSPSRRADRSISISPAASARQDTPPAGAFRFRSHRVMGVAGYRSQRDSAKIGLRNAGLGVYYPG